MPLNFVGDAISLSGLTGTKLKCEVIGQYYDLWWYITSGGPRRGYNFPTAFVELDAATGEVYIKETDEKVLGSAGHALNLKYTNPNTHKLKVILVEKHDGCYEKLKDVMKKRWSKANIQEAEKPVLENEGNVYLLNLEFSEALEEIDKIQLGNSMFFFDPLRSVTYDSIEKVTRRRIVDYYQNGTEFIIFIFTSDWFQGRDEFSPLPNTSNVDKWSPEEKSTVDEANSLFGHEAWQKELLTEDMIDVKQKKLITLYKDQLRDWFRYVLPMPFNPKGNQLFHLILCSNYEDGVKATRDFYSDRTGNPRYRPNNKNAYKLFRRRHPELLRGLKGNQRPIHWKLLWSTIKSHEDGVCDSFCVDYGREGIGANVIECEQRLQWLEIKGYLKRLTRSNAWNSDRVQYELNWITLKNNLGVDPPLQLRPLSVEMLNRDK
ncbi:MAG: hypothetical protein NWE89_09240 [Candidatus Bathyarchaeota archaeon]|nr:hypothetical protein [Candidatus Bathyarchaeota archaeon]